MNDVTCCLSSPLLATLNLNHTSNHGHVPTVHADYFSGDLKGLRTISVILRVYSSREFLFCSIQVPGWPDL